MDSAGYWIVENKNAALHRVRPCEAVRKCYWLHSQGRTLKIQLMPGRNIYKDYVSDSYYHVYNRGVDGQMIFRQESDYIVFLGLLKRYLGGNQTEKRRNGEPHPSYKGRVELLAFCLMPSHFHLLIYQFDEAAIKHLLKSLSVAYAMYFNKKYQRFGPIYQQRYRARRVTDDSYLLHISRYIHINPDSYKTWDWSSLPYYCGSHKADWILPGRILELFDGDDYSQFLDEYIERKTELEEIKSELALP